MNDRGLHLDPQNDEAERAVLGSVLLDNGVLPEIAPVLGVSDFYRGAHRTIYAAIRDIYGPCDRPFGNPVDISTLAAELIRHGHFDEIGGEGTLREVVDSVPHAANAKYYAGIVREKAIARQLIDLASRIIRDAYGNQYTAQELIDLAARGLRRIAGEEEPRAPFTYAEYLQSEHWQSFRVGALQRAGQRCQVCNSRGPILDCHHRTYERLWRELAEDVIVLCRGCHDVFHANGKLSRPT